MWIDRALLCTWPPAWPALGLVLVGGEAPRQRPAWLRVGTCWAGARMLASWCWAHQAPEQWVLQTAGRLPLLCHLCPSPG